jgi:hypothetical protein
MDNSEMGEINMKKYSFNVVEQAVFNDSNRRCARIEVIDNQLVEENPFPVIYEGFMMSSDPLFTKLVQLFDNEETDFIPTIILNSRV